jgi:hypothetical protein
MGERFEEWVKQPGVKERICKKLSTEERQRRLCRIFNRRADELQRKDGLSKATFPIIESKVKPL